MATPALLAAIQRSTATRLASANFLFFYFRTGHLAKNNLQKKRFAEHNN
jgi:hypothetical protein